MALDTMAVEMAQGICDRIIHDEVDKFLDILSKIREDIIEDAIQYRRTDEAFSTFQVQSYREIDAWLGDLVLALRRAQTDVQDDEADEQSERYTVETLDEGGWVIYDGGVPLEESPRITYLLRQTAVDECEIMNERD